MAEAEQTSVLTAMAVSLAADVGAAKAVTLLEGAGIPALLLKGASLAEWLFDANEVRPYGDADLLVSPSHHAAAEAVLARAGYKLLVRDLHASAWGLKDDPIVVDLHRRLWASSSPQVVWRILWGRSVTQEVGGRVLRVLDPVARALVVALHHAHHTSLGQSTGRTGDDLLRTLRVVDDREWVAVGDLAFDLRATVHLAVGLRALDDERAAAVADALGLPQGRRLASLTQPDGVIPIVGAVANLRLARGPRRKLRALLQEIAPPPDELRHRSALARRGAAGLALAYVLAPLWSLKQLPMVVDHLRKVARDR